MRGKSAFPLSVTGQSFHPNANFQENVKLQTTKQIV